MNLFDVYPLFDIAIDHGKGCHVWDDKGQEYLDLYGGHAVISIGHCHPHYVEAMTKQLNKLGFYSNSVQNPLQKELAARLGKASGYEDYQLFLINSGAEANENALKLSSFYNGRTRVLSLEKAFHGRTSLAVEVTNNPKIIAPINANGHATFLPLNALEAWKAELKKGDVAACIVLLSLLPIPDMKVDVNVPLADKWTHMVMYAGTCGVIAVEYWRCHKVIDMKRWILFGWLAPVVMSGVIELLQANCTGGRRSGELLDFAANTFGATLILCAGILWEWCRARR